MASTDDILRATLNFNIQGSSVGNMVWHYRVVSGTETDYVQIATDLETHLEGAFAATELLISDTVDPISLELAEWDFTDNEWDGKASVAANVPDGALAGDPYPTGIAALIRFPTDELRRQARKFIPGMVEAQITGDSLSAPLIAALVTSGALLNNDVVVGALSIRPCTFNDTPLSPRFETHSDYSTTSIVNINVAYQRRRQPGAGI